MDLDKFEKLELEALSTNIKIHKFDLSNTRIKGLYSDGNIALSKDLETTTEKACVLAEELGHHHTTVGNILDMKSTYNRKQERQARLWAYNKQIALHGLINAFEAGCCNRYEIAEYLEVTEEFLQDCLDCYRDKYGIGKKVDNYYIMFIPNLMVGKIM